MFLLSLFQTEAPYLLAGVFAVEDFGASVFAVEGFAVEGFAAGVFAVEALPAAGFKAPPLLPFLLKGAVSQ